jgi:hypothetical protein
MMLGLGDIILPGVFINFLRRFDYERGYKWWPTGYSTVGLVGCTYPSALCPFAFPFEFSSSPFSVDVVGLFMTFLALIILRRGQPALLYLVPCCLIPVALIAWRYGDLKLMWTGLQDESEQQQQQAETLDQEGDPPHSPSSDTGSNDESVTT